MAQLNQLQLRYVPREDRLLLRVNTTERSEFRFWITRRYAKLLWSALAASLGDNIRMHSAVDAHARQAILAFEHERALQQANFSRSFDNQAEQMPFGKAPVLLTRVQIRRQEDGRRLLCLHPRIGRGVELALSTELLHAWTRLLTVVIGKAGWDLNLPRPDPARSQQQSVLVN